MESEILTMAEFSKRRREDYPGYEYPTVPGTFFGTLSVLHWATHAIIHSLWILEDGRKVDCALFKEKRGYCGIRNSLLATRLNCPFRVAVAARYIFVKLGHQISQGEKLAWSTSGRAGSA